MPLPLFDPPPPKRIGVTSPEYFAFFVGMRQGQDGQARSSRYDEDDTIRRYYEDGYHIGSLFETRIRRRTEWKEPQR